MSKRPLYRSSIYFRGGCIGGKRRNVPTPFPEYYLAADADKQTVYRLRFRPDPNGKGKSYWYDAQPDIDADS